MAAQLRFVYSDRKLINARLRRFLQKLTVRSIPGFGGRPPIQQHEALTKKRKRWTHPLDNNLAKDTITYGQYIGGVRFRSDYELAAIPGEQTTQWSRIADCAHRGSKTSAKRPKRQPRAHYEHAPHRIDAVQALARIRSEMTGVEFKLLVAVCGHGISVNELSSAVAADRHVLSHDFHNALNACADFYNSSIDCRDKS